MLVAAMTDPSPPSSGHRTGEIGEGSATSVSWSHHLLSCDPNCKSPEQGRKCKTDQQPKIFSKFQWCRMMAEQVEGAAHNWVSIKERTVHQPGYNHLTRKAPRGTPRMTPRAEATWRDWQLSEAFYLKNLVHSSWAVGGGHETFSVASGTPNVQNRTVFLPETKPEVLSGS